VPKKTGARSARGTWGKNQPVNKKQTDTLNIFKILIFTRGK
jgi:hypothetical protein